MSVSPFRSPRATGLVEVCECVCVCIPCGSSGQQMWSVWKCLWLLFPTVSVSPGRNHTARLCWRTPSQSQSCPGSQTLQYNTFTPMTSSRHVHMQYLLISTMRHTYVCNYPLKVWNHIYFLRPGKNLQPRATLSETGESGSLIWAIFSFKIFTYTYVHKQIFMHVFCKTQAASNINRIFYSGNLKCFRGVSLHIIGDVTQRTQPY